MQALRSQRAPQNSRLGRASVNKQTNQVWNASRSQVAANKTLANLLLLFARRTQQQDRHSKQIGQGVGASFYRAKQPVRLSRLASICSHRSIISSSCLAGTIIAQSTLESNALSMQQLASSSHNIEPKAGLFWPARLLFVFAARFRLCARF